MGVCPPDVGSSTNMRCRRPAGCPCPCQGFDYPGGLHLDQRRHTKLRRAALVWQRTESFSSGSGAVFVLLGLGTWTNWRFDRRPADHDGDGAIAGKFRRNQIAGEIDAI